MLIEVCGFFPGPNEKAQSFWNAKLSTTRLSDEERCVPMIQELLALALAVAAAWLDWRSRRIPNWLTVSGFAAGLLVNGLVLHWRGLATGLEGSAMALVLLLPLVLLRSLGAGDWKLMGALGAFWGPRMVLLILLATVLIAGLMAGIEVVRLRRARETVRNLVVLVHGVFTFGVRPGSPLGFEASGALAIPFGVAAAAGSAAVFALVHLKLIEAALRAWR